MSGELERLIREYVPGGFRDEDGVWHDGPLQAGALALLSARERENAARDERDAWLARQLDGAIGRAEALVYATDLATSRALLGDIKDARAALAAAGFPVDEPDEGARILEIRLEREDFEPALAKAGIDPDTVTADEWRKFTDSFLDGTAWSEVAELATDAILAQRPRS